jgi:hypothetical protein
MNKLLHNYIRFIILKTSIDTLEFNDNKTKFIKLLNTNFQ